MKNIAITLIVFAFSSPLFAAPIPGTGASKLVKPGLYKSSLGFEISRSTTNWVQTRPPKSSKHIATVYRSPKLNHNTRASLTVRIDRMKSRIPLKSYIKRWVKEYPKFGFDVLGKKSFNMKNNKGYVIDLVNSQKKRKLRQVVFMKNRLAVIMTCRDHLRSFSGTLKECNQIIRSFSWKGTQRKSLSKKQKIKRKRKRSAKKRKLLRKRRRKLAI